jgi:antitoxin component YwqK of YwqJK toxin-antitoxin module
LFVSAGDPPVVNPNPVNNSFKKDNLPDGETKYYFANGSVSQIVHAKNGNLDGDLKTYYKDGSLQEITHFIKGHFNDTGKLYNSDGSISELSVYHCDTLLYFSQSDYYKNGQLSWTRYNLFDKDSLKLCPFLKSRHVAGWTWFDPNETFKYLPSHGKLLFYFKNGKLSEEDELVNNRKEGPGTGYYDDGSVYWTGSYHLDKMNGNFIYYDAEGKEKKREEWKDGKKVR